MNPRHFDETKTCMRCEHYHEEWDGEQGEIFCGVHCNLTPRYGNLLAFPFKKKMPCFQVNFWFSRFTVLVDGGDPKDCRGSFYFQQADPDGNLPPELEAQFQEELKLSREK